MKQCKACYAENLTNRALICAVDPQFCGHGLTTTWRPGKAVHLAYIQAVVAHQWCARWNRGYPAMRLVS